MATWREPTAEEKSVLALAEISDGLTDFAEIYAAKLGGFQAEAIDMIGKAIAAGRVDAVSIADGASLGEFPGREQMVAELHLLLVQGATFGKEQLDAELARQADISDKS